MTRSCHTRAIGLFPAALLAVALVFAEGRAAAAVSPTTTPPAPSHWVTDSTGFLSPQTAAALDERLSRYERSTGHQVIVWIGGPLGQDSLEDWSARVFKAWGIGNKKQDDGAALFIFPQERKMRIEVGYGLEGQLTDLAAARIIREQMTPRLRSGDRDGAVTAAIDEVLGTLGGEEGAPPRPVAAPENQRLGWGSMILLGLVLLFVFGFLVTHPAFAAALLFTMSARGQRRGGGWGGTGFMGGGGGGGGGFSGGGGSSGGGGASGSW